MRVHYFVPFALGLPLSSTKLFMRLEIDAGILRKFAGADGGIDVAEHQSFWQLYRSAAGENVMPRGDKTNTPISRFVTPIASQNAMNRVAFRRMKPNEGRGQR